MATSQGVRPIESIQCGEQVTLIGLDGQSTLGKVDSCFQTKNLLVEVQTGDQSLLTTPTQPLCLVEGGFRRAGDLVAGDRIWRWDGQKRLATRVLNVVVTEREVVVHNLVVGTEAIFVANGFLARGKPALDAAVPIVSDPEVR